MSVTFNVDGTVVLQSDVDPSIKRVLSADLSREEKDAEIKAFHTQDLPPSTAIDVEAERDRRIQAGVTFKGVLYQTRDSDQDNIQGARQLAFAAIVLNGAKAGDLRWHGGASDFVWIAADNSRVPMDAPTVMAFSTAVAAAKSALIFAASDLKARIASGEVIIDCADPSYWPG